MLLKMSLNIGFFNTGHPTNYFNVRPLRSAIELMQGQAQVPWDLVGLRSQLVNSCSVSVTCDLTSQTWNSGCLFRRQGKEGVGNESGSYTGKVIQKA